MSDHIAAVAQAQRTEKGLRYEKNMERLQNLIVAGGPKAKALRDEVMRVKAVGVENVYTIKTLQSMSVQYANDEYIGDRLMPMVNAGPQPTGTYFIYDKRSRLAYPSDDLADRGMANEIDDSRSTASFACVDRGLSNSVSKRVVDAQDAPLNELIDLTEAINEGLALKREQRQATIFCTAGNYGGNTGAIAAGNRWDSAGGGSPVKDIQTALKGLWQGRGPSKKVGFCSRDVWDVLARHQEILDLFKYNGSSPGLATPAMLAGWFGLDTILVGDARQDTANSGQTVSYSRIWSDVFGVVRVAMRPTIRNASFAYRFLVDGAPKATQWYDQRPGLDGRYYAKVAVSEDMKVVAADTGWLITTPIG